MIVNSSQGGGSKYTWVLEDGVDAGVTRRRSRVGAPADAGSPPGGTWSSQQQQQQQ